MKSRKAKVPEIASISFDFSWILIPAGSPGLFRLLLFVHFAINTDFEFSSLSSDLLNTILEIGLPDVRHWNTRPPASTVGCIL